MIANKVDKDPNADLRTKSYLSAGMCFIAVPLCLMLFMLQGNFYISVCMLFLYDLMCLGYYAPVMSMVQGTIEPEKKGAAIGAFGFANNYIQAVVSLFIGWLVTHYKLDENQRDFGMLCAVLTAVPNLLAGLCFLYAGKPYEEIKLKQQEEADQAVEKAEKAEIELEEETIKSLRHSIGSFKRSLVNQIAQKRFNNPINSMQGRINATRVQAS